jgi:hypothetical protein
VTRPPATPAAFTERIRRAGPCHGSGNTARKLFPQRFADRCLLPGPGTVVRLDGNS